MERRELDSLARFLRERLGPEPIAGYEVGRSVLREEVMDALDCTHTQAELLVRQLERDGLIRFSAETDDAPIGGGVWELSAP